MKVKLEGAGRSRRERMEARRAIPVPTDGLPPKLTTGGEAETPEPMAAEQVSTAATHTPIAAARPAPPVAESPERIPEPVSTPTRPEPVVNEAMPESATPASIAAGPKPRKRVSTKASGNAGGKADTVKVKVTIFLTEEDATLLEAEAQRIGGVTPEVLMRKLNREFVAPMLTLDPGQEPELKLVGKMVRKYRADLTFPVPSGVLARYRAKYDKLGAYSDGILVRHEAVPAFRSHMLDIIRKLGR